MDNEKLIKLVREYKFLYDLSDRRYSDNQRKDEAWCEIARKLQVNEKDCKRAWNLLRDAFRRAIKKQKETKSGQASISTKKWKYEEEMSYLLPYFKTRSTLGTVRYEHKNATDNEDSAPRIAPNELQPRSASPENIPTGSAQNSTPLPKRKKIGTASPGSNTEESPSTTPIKYILENKTKNIDVQLFFDSIANTVQSFPPRDRAIAKVKVFEVISKMELEILSRHTYSNIESPASHETAMPESPSDFEIEIQIPPPAPQAHMYKDYKHVSTTKNHDPKDTTASKNWAYKDTTSKEHNLNIH